VVALAGVALIHLLDLPGKFGETPYLGWMYVGLIISCVVVGAGLIHSGSRKAWAGTAALSLAVLIGFVLSRTTGLPNATGDIGNWGEPLGIASMFVEGALLMLSAAVLAGVARLGAWNTTASRAPRQTAPRAGDRRMGGAAA
jgi:hypothetical protein